MTAVEWLEQQLKDTYDKEGKLPLAYTLDLVKQAKQMEKDEITEAWNDGNYHGRNGDRIADYNTVRQYYNETYSK